MIKTIKEKIEQIEFYSRELLEKADKLTTDEIKSIDDILFMIPFFIWWQKIRCTR